MNIQLKWMILGVPLFPSMWGLQILLGKLSKLKHVAAEELYKFFLWILHLTCTCIAYVTTNLDYSTLEAQIVNRTDWPQTPHSLNLQLTWSLVAASVSKADRSEVIRWKQLLNIYFGSTSQATSLQNTGRALCFKPGFKFWQKLIPLTWAVWKTYSNIRQIKVDDYFGISPSWIRLVGFWTIKRWR